MKHVARGSWEITYAYGPNSSAQTALVIAATADEAIVLFRKEGNANKKIVSVKASDPRITSIIVADKQGLYR